MDQATPEQLHPHRVYFTALDRVTYSQVAWTPEDVEQIKCSLVRTLKLLALTKGHVVIAASHLLESELAREIILPYPELISRRIVVPALREDFASCNAFLETKRASPAPGEASLYTGEEQRAMAQLVDSEGLIVRWNPIETSDWFKARLLRDLRDEKSLVRNLLYRHILSVPEDLCLELEEAPTLSRGLIYHATQRHGTLPFREIVNNYADFLYYLGGARAVQSEGILPQENILDFGLHDFDSDRCPLSEHEIFTKLFVDAVKAATSTHFPADFLDALEIPDVLRLHSVAVDESFVEKYNAIQIRTKAALEITDPERLVLLMNELLALESDLHRAFSDAVNKELPAKLREIKIGRHAALIHALTSLIILPYGALMGMKDILVSALRVLHQDSLATDIQDRINGRLGALRRRAGEALGGEKPTLLNFIEELKAQYKRQLRGEVR
ncbi:hypothetical protein OAC89_01455 [Deltaproteobacteria bacterium]|nr:hypothetical protein [Deltaproteobacteria bacterium]